jgi:NADH:ubiquinone oxidoreductase subunit H
LESELVSGFMTEHAAVIFVFFFLAEYASIVVICILTSILFLGGYNIPFKLDQLSDQIYDSTALSSIILGIKSSILIFTFI